MAITNFSVLILSPYFMLCTFEPCSAACVRLRIIDRSQWRDQQLRDSAVLSLRHSFIHGLLNERASWRERVRQRDTHTHAHTQTATAWPLSSKHPYTTDLWRGEGIRELRLFVAKQQMTQHRIVRRCTNSSQGLERYSHIAVGRLLQPLAQT